MSPLGDKTLVTNGNPILCRLYRGEYLESVHRGKLVLVGPDGLLESRGDIHEPVLPRSSLKPLQLLPLFATGEPARLGLTPQEQAILVASHSGDEKHVEAVRGILAKAGVPEDALGCGASEPLDHEAMIRIYKRGEDPLRVHHNCSGKHAGFLLRAHMMGASLEGYLDPAHPVHVEIRETLEDLTGMHLTEEDAVIDGCGAPMYSLPMETMASLIRDIANPDRLPEKYRKAADAIFTAVNAAPHYLAGRARIDTAILQSVPGRYFVKCGAEAYFVLGVRACSEHPAMGLALKVTDGASRGYESFLARYLREKDLLKGTEASMAPFFDGKIKNSQGLTIGEYRTEHESPGRI